MSKETQPILITPYDTTLRDGAQTPGINLTVANKLRIAGKLNELGFHYIEGGWPGANSTDTEFFQEVKGRLSRSQLTAFGMTGRIGTRPENDDGLNALLRSDTDIITLFGKSWMLHVKHALRTTGLKNLDTIYQSITFLKNQGRRVFYDAEHFYDGFKDNPEYALKTLEAACKAGAEVIILCDTNGGNTHDLIYDATLAAKNHLDENFPLGVHIHNDSGLAVINTIMAIRAGATQVQGTINGAGERCGNVDFCVLLPTAEFKYGITSGLDLTRMQELSRFVELENGSVVPPNTPYVGSKAFTHKGGVHSSAQQRHLEAYEHIDPTLVGATRGYESSDQGGSAHVEEMARKHGFELSRNDPRFRLLVERMKRMRLLGDAQEFLLLYEVLSDEPMPFEILDGSRVITTRGAIPEASVQIRVNGSKIQDIAMGNGPINAFDNALRKVLRNYYPAIDQVQLVHYGMPNTQKIGTDAEVLISTEFGANGDRWTSIAYGTNQQEAGERALVDSYNYYILRKHAELTTNTI